MDGMKAYKRSLILDIAGIAVALVVLYCANSELLPVWSLVVGAVIAAALVIAAVRQLVKARRIFKQEEAQYAEQAKQEGEEEKEDTAEE